MDEQIDGTGEVLDAGDQGDVLATDTQVETTAATDTAVAETTATATTAAADKPVEEQFIDPSTLPPELKAHWTRMHGTYNKRLAEIRAGKQDIDFLAAFRKDPEFAKTVLIAEAQRLGLQIAAPNGAATQPATATAPQQGGDAPPPQLVENIKSRLAPELQWMADQLAAASWAGSQFANAPREAAERERKVAELKAQFNEAAEKLSAAAPGWEAHETDMYELDRFLKSRDLTHPKFGSRLELLHKLAAPSNTGRARVDALRAQAEAAKNASRTGQPGRSTTSNISERVRKASNPREAIAIASEEAERELRAMGVAVPD